MPLSEVMLPPHGTDGGGREGEVQYIYTSEGAADTGRQIHYSAAIIGKRGEKKRGRVFFPLFLSLWSSAPLLGVSLPLFFAFRLVPWRLSGLKISQQSLLASGGSDGVFHQDKASTLSHWG